ncbi:MAG: FtsX-like permease family protein, partial [Ruthenibacterium sp.]
NADYSVRKSIAAIATKRGGILTADSYDIVNQLYKSGLQGAFLFGVAGFLLGALGVLLLGNLFASSLDTQRKRIGVLQAVGASGHKLQGAYVWRSAVQLVFALLFSNLLVFIPIQLLNTPRVLVTFLKTQTMNPTLRFPYPWQAHLLLCALLTLVILLLEWAPLHKVLKQSPAQNMMQAGGV